MNRNERDSKSLLRAQRRLTSTSTYETVLNYACKEWLTVERRGKEGGKKVSEIK